MKHHVAPNMHAAKWRSLRDRPLQSPCRRVHRKTFDRDFAVGDRKSTRLNSSHTVISYAVFCLKKKEKSSRSYDEDKTDSGGGFCAHTLAHRDTESTADSPHVERQASRETFSDASCYRRYLHVQTTYYSLVRENI